MAPHIEPSPALSALSVEKDKEKIAHIEDTSRMSRDEKIKAVDAIANDPNVTLESFAHLDIKKILWKIDRRLVPMLTLLVCL